MAEKQTRKNQTEMNSEITPILITGNDRLMPYIQVFTHQPENVSQYALGTLFGIFKIDDTGVDSAFVVNFLVSELKKEYYGNPRRTPAGSFEAGLNRINIALSELAKQGNIAWIGKLESAVCALEKNGVLHFSVTGSSHIALLREGALSFISEDLAPESPNPSPLKTFIEISSGKLHPEDLVVLGTHELFDFLPKEKMERSARHFNYPEFTRFLHTALVNEFDFCAAITVTLQKKLNTSSAKKPESNHLVTPDSIPNLWGGNSLPQRSVPQEILSPSEKSFSDEDFTPKEQPKNGHIYIQQQPIPEDVSRQELRETFLIFKEHLANLWDEQKRSLSTLLRQWRRTVAKKIIEYREKKINISLPESLNHESIAVAEEILPQVSIPIEKPTIPETEIISDISKKTRPQKSVTEIFKEKPLSKTQKEKIPLFIPDPIQHIPVQEVSENTTFKQFLNSLQNFFIRLRLTEKFPSALKISLSSLQKNGRNLWSAFLSSLSRLSSFLRYTFFRFQKLPILWRSGVIIATLLLITLPFLLFSFSKKTAVPEPVSEAVVQEPEISPREKLFSKEKNALFPKKETLSAIHTSQNNIQSLFSLDDSLLLAIEDRSVILLPGNGSLQQYPFPEGSDDAVSATYMNDLSTLFILTKKGSLLSFSPVSKKFSENNLTLENADSGKILIGSYLTYLYVADTIKNTILRYPRAEGGFGTPSSWLSSDSGISLAGSTSLAIDGSLYFTKPDTLLRLSNKKEDLITLEKTSVPAIFSGISLTSENILITDSAHNRVLSFKMDGTLEQQIILPEESPNILSVLRLSDQSIILQSEHEISQWKK